MAKYIGTYANSGDVQTALNNLELSRPFIAYTTDNDKVYYGPAADKAEVGDIVVYSVADDLLHYIKQADYNTTSYPVADYVPVGVVSMPQADDAILGPSGEITFMGLNWISKTSPDSGTSRDEIMEWGYNNFDIPELTNYSNTGTAITDMNGKANTEAVLQYATAQTDWRTASAITFVNEPGYYPAFECAWRYHTSGTLQGDWFVPACGQLYYILENKLSLLNAAFNKLGLPNYNLNTLNGTSTEYDKSRAYYRNRSNLWTIESNGIKNGGTGKCHPYCSKLMTRI